MKEIVRKLLETHLDMARNTASDIVAEVQLNIALGFIEYASANGDITPVQFHAESQVLKAIRERRRVASIAKGAAHA